MGMKEGDKLLKSQNSYSSKLITIVIQFIMLGYHLIMYAEDTLNIIEILTFMIILISFGIRIWAFYELGDMFTFILGTREDHKLVTTGPYKYVAHPGYTGQLLLAVFLVILSNPPKLLIVPLTMYICYRFYTRIKKEEKMLSEKFKNDYESYIAIVKWRVIPKIY